ncbi:hypothetical protein AB6A40_011003, partial [Gnathostoma spinigerum]
CGPQQPARPGAMPGAMPGVGPLAARNPRNAPEAEEHAVGTGNLLLAKAVHSVKRESISESENSMKKFSDLKYGKHR